MLFAIFMPLHYFTAEMTLSPKQPVSGHDYDFGPAAVFDAKKTQTRLKFRQQSFSSQFAIILSDTKT